MYEEIFEHSSREITHEDLKNIKAEIFDRMIYLCFKKNKYILNDKIIETI